MELTVATNWDMELINQLKIINGNNPKNKITEIFGSLPKGYYGSARPSIILPHVDEEYVRNYLKVARANGLNFNYIFNSSTLGNRELTDIGKKELHKIIEWIIDIGANIITVTIPFVSEFIRDNYPNLPINISTINEISTIQKFNHFKQLGASRITLSFFSNRDFTFLKKVTEDSFDNIEILANEHCMFMCPYRQYHYNFLSYSSLEDNGVIENKVCNLYPIVTCTLHKIKNLRENISSPWIRPEDLHYYKDMGIKWLKISHRMMPTNWLARAANAYANESYDGNLYDIVDPGNFKLTSILKRFPMFYKFATKEEMEYLENFELYVDNKKLDGFLETMQSMKTEHLDCKSCNYCDKISEEVISFDGDKRKAFIKLLESIRSEILE